MDPIPQLSTEAGGRRCLKSCTYDTYLRARDSDKNVDLVKGPAGSSEHWFVEDWHGKVVFRAIHSPEQFLRAQPGGRVDLGKRSKDWDTWTPLKNYDGTWSFLSFHGYWLSAEEDGSVTTVHKCDNQEHFWLERWDVEGSQPQNGTLAEELQTDNMQIHDELIQVGVCMTVSAEASGHRSLKSCMFGTYLRAYETESADSSKSTPNPKFTLGSAVSKDGWLTRAVETIPRGGFFTAPFHAAAGNSSHAKQAVVKGVGTVTASVVAGPVGAISACAGTVAYTSIRDKYSENTGAQKTCERGNDAAQALSDITQKKLDSQQSCHGAYSRDYDHEWKVDMTSGPARDCENWCVEDWRGKVVFKTFHSPARFLSAHPDGRIFLSDRPKEWETWTPLKNYNGSWSFRSHHGKWLSPLADGSVTSVHNCDARERLWLEWW